MYERNIHNFMPQYPNFQIAELKLLLEDANKVGFNQYKLEKDFLLTLILAKISTNPAYANLIFK
jgi:hypothetical protein